MRGGKTPQKDLVVVVVLLLLRPCPILKSVTKGYGERDESPSACCAIVDRLTRMCALLRRRCVTLSVLGCLTGLIFARKSRDFATSKGVPRPAVRLRSARRVSRIDWIRFGPRRASYGTTGKTYVAGVGKVVTVSSMSYSPPLAQSRNVPRGTRGKRLGCCRRKLSLCAGALLKKRRLSSSAYACVVVVGR